MLFIAILEIRKFLKLNFMFSSIFRKGDLFCIRFIQEKGGDDAEGLREGEKEGRFTVYFFHPGKGWR